MSRRDPALPALDLPDSLWLLSSFCTLHRTAFDPNLFAQRYPAPVAPEAFSRAAAELGLTLAQKSCGLQTALAWRLPIAIALNPQADSSPPSEAAQAVPDGGKPLCWALVLNADEQRVVLIERGQSAPVAVPVAEVAARYLGLALSLAPQAETAADPDTIETRHARFGLHWFVPELLKHRRVWRDVLLAPSSCS